MVPFQVILIPTFLIVKDIGLVDSVGGLIMPNLCSAFGIFMLRQFFRTLPIELEEAARIDGCSRFAAFLRVTLPLSTPALASYGAIVFIVAWNDLLIPLILNNRAEFMTLPVVIASLVSDLFVFHNLMMAICLIALAPSVILVLLLRRFVVEGLSAGAMKG